MASNPETKVTNRIRNLLKMNGAHFTKLSDSFTRGVPDAYVVTNRVIMMEFKVDRSKGISRERTYKSLGLSGAQDHTMKAINRRAPGCGYVVTDTVKGDRLRVWIPMSTDENSEMYGCISESDEEFLRVVGLVR